MEARDQGRHFQSHTIHAIVFSLMPNKYPINESSFPSVPKPNELRETYDALRVASIGNNISSGLKLSHRDKLIDQLYFDLRNMRTQLREASEGKLLALQRMDQLIAQIEEDAKAWERLEIVGDDFTSAIDQYRRGLGKFSGGRPIQALIGACYRFLTTWRTIKKLRTYREQNLNDSIDSQISAEAEGGDQARRDGNSSSDGHIGSRLIQGSSNPRQGSHPDD